MSTKRVDGPSHQNPVGFPQCCRVMAPPLSRSPACRQGVRNWDCVVYWGIDKSGEYFETLPLDATDPSNLGIESPDEVLPLNEEASPIIISEDGGEVLEGAEAEQHLRSQQQSEVAPLALYCERTVSKMHLGGGHLSAQAIQNCSGAFTNQWIDASIQRAVGWWQVEYSPWRNWSGGSQEMISWNLLQACNIDGTSRYGEYRWNTRGWATHTDGTTVGGNEVWGEATGYNCGY